MRRLVLLGVLVVLLVPAHGSAYEPQPGLPDDLPWQPPNDTAWWGIMQTGMSHTAKAEQFAAIPLHIALVHTQNASAVDPELGIRVFTTQNRAFFLSEPEADHPYGHQPPFTVRTVAFGSVPVEATVQVSQQRDEDDLPIPIDIVTRDYRCDAIADPPPGCGTGSSQDRVFEDTVVDDAVWVRILALEVDGVDLGVTGRCETVDPAPLSLVGPGFIGVGLPMDGMIENGWFAAARGGVLAGELDLPAFGDCLTSSGDDISAMVTGTVSGPGNSVRLHATSPVCLGPDGQAAPIPPGSAIEDVCFNLERNTPPEVPYPERGDAGASLAPGMRTTSRRTTARRSAQHTVDHAMSAGGVAPRVHSSKVALRRTKR